MTRTAHSGVVMVGSANMDIVFGVERIPKPGETLIADSIAKYPGGKGLNQAIAASRAGARTVFIGALGGDENGDELFATMTDAAIDSSLLRRVASASGQAFIAVADNAENTIIVASGANAEVISLTPEEGAAIAQADVVLLQLELPLDVVSESVRIARGNGTTVILNAAPARELPAEIIDSIDCLIVNEHEACLLGGSENLAVATDRLAARVNRLIVTLGAAGSALYESGNSVGQIPAIAVQAIDTTGAGDTYCGAFAAAIAEGQSFTASAGFATAAAALSVQALGAVPSIPTRERINALVTEHP